MAKDVSSNHDYSNHQLRLRLGIDSNPDSGLSHHVPNGKSKKRPATSNMLEKVKEARRIDQDLPGQAIKVGQRTL